MTSIKLLGYVAGILTSVSALPQFLKIIKTDSTKDLSGKTMVTLVIGLILWLVYGIANRDLPLVVANILSIILNGSILLIKINHKRKGM